MAAHNRRQIDTLFAYAIEPEIVEGIVKLGLDPTDIKYVLISHAHGDHDQGAAPSTKPLRCESRDGRLITIGGLYHGRREQRS